MTDEGRPTDGGAPEPTTSDGSVDVNSDRGRIELVAAILLGIAGLLTAYAAYYGALAGGDAIKGYTQSQRTTADANGYYSDALQIYNGDQSVFLAYQLKVEEGDLETAQVIRDNLFSPALETATAAWEADPTNEWATPLDHPAYVIEEYALGDELYQQADDEFAEAQEIDDQGDRMDLASVFLAVSLFFAGIAGLFKVRRLSIALLIGSALLIIPGIYAIGKGRAWW